MIFTPTAFPAVTGNAMTAERWRRALSSLGLYARVVATDGLGAADLRREIDRARPDLLHVHHAFRAGGLLLDRSLSEAVSGLPFVVSPSGTDLNVDFHETEKKGVIERVLRRADAVVAQSAEGMQRLRDILPGILERVFHIPKAVAWLGEEPCDLRTSAGVLFFMPAGVRPVKGNLECLLGLEKVFGLRPAVRAVFAGPPLDGAYADRFKREVERLRAFARWIPAIPPAAMRSAYDSADVVVNGSRSEGLSNVILEARAAGKPILASDVPGNRWPVVGNPGDPPAGILFDPSDPGDFARKALRLADDEALRRSLGGAGARHRSDPAEEARALAAVYETAARERV
jgi:glycosyltransferase involved in cell wall biosynthesis